MTQAELDFYTGSVRALKEIAHEVAEATKAIKEANKLLKEISDNME